MAEGVVVAGLSFSYERGRPVLQDLDLELPAGSFTAVVGPNGSGKSTLLKVLAGVCRPDTGSVRVSGLDVARTRARQRARRIAYLPQSEPDDAPFSAMELVLMGRFAYQGLLPFDRLADVDVARRCLRRVEALGLADRLLGEMSGGERQRVHLARALAQDPETLLLDEPASSLDFHYQVETYRLLAGLNREQGRTVVLVSHDLNLPAACSDHVALLEGGRLRAFGPPDRILRAKVLEPVYGTRIIEARAPELPHPVLHPVPGEGS